MLDQFINIRLGISNDEIIDPVLEELASIPEYEHEFLRQYYRSFFDMWEKRNDLDAMKRWYRGCLKSPHSGLLPLDDFFYRIANKILNTGSLNDLLSYIDSNDDLLAPEQKENLLNNLWSHYLPVIKNINLTNQSLKLAIKELYDKQRNAAP